MPWYIKCRFRCIEGVSIPLDLQHMPWARYIIQIGWLCVSNDPLKIFFSCMEILHLAMSSLRPLNKEELHVCRTTGAMWPGICHFVPSTISFSLPIYVMQVVIGTYYNSILQRVHGAIRSQNQSVRNGLTIWVIGWFLVLRRFSNISVISRQSEWNTSDNIWHSNRFHS
jgi:hypothetical protein